MRRSPAGERSSLLDPPIHAEDYAGVLANATSPGDAGNRSDHFLGTALESRWTGTWTNNPSPSVSNSVLAFNAGNVGPSTVLQTFTPTGAFRIEARCASTRDPITGTPGGGIQVCATDGSSNYVAFEFGQAWQMNKTVAGTFSIVANLTSAYQEMTYMNNLGGGAGGGSYIPGLLWGYMSLERDGSNNWTVQGSWDRNFWQTVGTLNFAVSVSKIQILGFTTAGNFYIDFLDVVK